MHRPLTMMIDNHNVIPEVIYEVLSTWSLVGHKDYKHHFMYGVRAPEITPR